MAYELVNLETGQVISYEWVFKEVRDMSVDDLVNNYAKIKQLDKIIYEFKKLIEGCIKQNLVANQTIIETDTVKIIKKKGGHDAIIRDEKELRDWLDQKGYIDIKTEDIAKRSITISKKATNELVKRGYPELDELFKEKPDFLSVELKR